MIDTKVVQTASNDHDQIRKIVFRVSQDVFHGTRTFDTRNGMLDTDTNFGDLAIALFLFGSQVLLARLFFG